MADEHQLALLGRGAAAWNRWRRRNPGVTPDLSGAPEDQLARDVRAITATVMNEVGTAGDPGPGDEWRLKDLSGADLSGADLRWGGFDGAILIQANLSGAALEGARLSGCILTGASLGGASARGVDLSQAVLRWADLSGADLREAVLRRTGLDAARLVGADLRGANLFYASLVGANLEGADISGAHVYGVSAWDVRLDGAAQRDLVITRGREIPVTVDDLEVAQFLHGLLDNRRMRAVIDTVTTRLVVILGRFTPRRKRVLDAIRNELRARGYVPMLFDFDRPANRDLTETVSTLAHLARFVIADLTDPASVPKELEAIVPTLAVPVRPLIRRGERPYAMFADYWKYDWVLPVAQYSDVRDLRRGFDTLVVAPAEDAVRSLAVRRARALADSDAPADRPPPYSQD